MDMRVQGRRDQATGQPAAAAAAAPARPPGPAVAAGPAATPGPATPPVLKPWLAAQAVNTARHLAALRPFATGEFGSDAAAPSQGHLEAVNGLIGSLRRDVDTLTAGVGDLAVGAAAEPSTARLGLLVTEKTRAQRVTHALERVWDFYFELFGQRQSRFGDWLLACDRIALDCYQYAFIGLPVARSIPAPAPFSYMRTGFSPATFRRRIPLRALGQQLNPFPLVQLPYHRLINPWALGAVLHEVSHNLQNDLGLAESVPRQVADRLAAAGHDARVTATWVRWNREIFADLSGLLLGGPAIVASLLDVVGQAPAATLAWRPGAVHPTPVLRPHLSIELLRRMGFPEPADRYERLWRRLYPNPGAGTVPRPFLEAFPAAVATVVDAICFQPYPSLGGRSLAQIYRFAPKDQELVEEAAGRLAAGTDPGVLPERFLIGAARSTLDRRLAEPEVLMGHFYRHLARR
jgi:hypothetical protein